MSRPKRLHFSKLLGRDTSRPYTESSNIHITSFFVTSFFVVATKIVQIVRMSKKRREKMPNMYKNFILTYPRLYIISRANHNWKRGSAMNKPSSVLSISSRSTRVFFSFGRLERLPRLYLPATSFFQFM